MALERILGRTWGLMDAKFGRNIDAGWSRWTDVWSVIVDRPMVEVGYGRYSCGVHGGATWCCCWVDRVGESLEPDCKVVRRDVSRGVRRVEPLR